MSEYLDNIFTDTDLVSEEFLNEINKDLSDITGYQEIYDSDVKKHNEAKDEIVEDPLNEVLKKENVETVETKRTILTKLTNADKIRILKKPRDKGKIAIDETGDIVCKSWGNYYISGNHNIVETTVIINDYFEECEKPVSERNFDRFIIGKKTIVEKFNDMDFYRGRIDVKAFYENVED